MRTIHLEGGLSGPNVKKSATSKEHGTHLGKRLSKLVRDNRWVDVMVPVTWGRHWVLLILNFEERKAHLVYFSQGTAKEPLDLLMELALKLVEVAIKESVKSVLGFWHGEEGFISTWEWTKTMCVTKHEDK
jgi:hypothetical protein